MEGMRHFVPCVKTRNTIVMLAAAIAEPKSGPGVLIVSVHVRRACMRGATESDRASRGDMCGAAHSGSLGQRGCDSKSQG